MAKRPALPRGEDLIKLHDEIDSAINQSTYSVADYTFGSLRQLIDSGAIDIRPEYQRGDVWGTKEQSKWIESALMGIPLPPVFLFKRPKVADNTSVIDGKQRLTAIFRFMDINEGFRLEKLKKLPQLNGLNFKDFIQINIASYLEQISIRTFTLKNRDIKMISEVFQRLNSGGIQLNDQEIRKAIFFDAPFTRVLKTIADNDLFSKMIRIKRERQERMLNQEYALRYFAFRRGRHDRFIHDVDEFLTDAYAEMADFSEEQAQQAGVEFAETVEAIHNALGDYAFRSIKNGKVSPVVSMTLLDGTFAAFDGMSPLVAKRASSRIRDAYREAWRHPEFCHLFSGPGSNTKRKALDRIASMTEIANVAAEVK